MGCMLDLLHLTTHIKDVYYATLQGDMVVGCMLDIDGTISCLRWQPAPAEFGQPWGTVCVYR